MRKALLDKINASNDTQVDLGTMNIIDNEIQELMEYLMCKKLNLRYLNLDQNQVSDPGARVLSQYLSRFPDLQELSIQFNQIGEKGAQQLFQLKQQKNDLVIYFRENQIHDAELMAAIEEGTYQTNRIK